MKTNRIVDILSDIEAIPSPSGYTGDLVAHLRGRLKAQGLFSNYEEVGHGAAAGFPATVREMLVVDMGVIGKSVAGMETAVSICAKDSSGPQDYELRCRLVKLAKKRRIPHVVDVFPYYGSDAAIALRAGYDLRAGIIGPGVSASHGVERTHVKGLKATADLVKAYVRGLPALVKKRR